MNEKQAPFATLGTHLKYLREQSRESLAEVSGAVEIEEIHLDRIEAGLERPDEEILLLLISHFDMQDQEAVQLWELAGYGGEVPEQIRPSDSTGGNKPVVMVLALDTRTIYTDGAEIDAGPGGITMNFTQLNGQGEATPIARLGMSYEQAEAVMQALYQSVTKGKFMKQPKALPPQIDCPHNEHDHEN